MKDQSVNLQSHKNSSPWGEWSRTSQWTFRATRTVLREVSGPGSVRKPSEPQEQFSIQWVWSLSQVQAAKAHLQGVLEELQGEVEALQTQRDQQQAKVQELEEDLQRQGEQHQQQVDALQAQLQGWLCYGPGCACACGCGWMGVCVGVCVCVCVLCACVCVCVCVCVNKSFRWDYKLRSPVCIHVQKRSHTHIKDSVVHVRVWWIMGMPK